MKRPALWLGLGMVLPGALLVAMAVLAFAAAVRFAGGKKPRRRLS